MIARPAISLRREKFAGENDADHCSRYEAATLRTLLAQDGSTTRLLEHVVRATISVHVVEQHDIDELALHLQGELPGRRFLRRISSLEAGGHVLLDSISYVAAEVLPVPVERELEHCISPIGHVLAHLWTRRAFRELDNGVFEGLWSIVGKPDPHASRFLRLYTPRTPIMLLGETFRRGIVLHLNG